MNRINTVLAAFLIASLSACASKPVADRYYSLVLAADDGVTSAADSAVEATVVLGPVVLPSYLNRRGLVIQTGASQVQTANHHFWAESLDEAIATVLVRDISRQANGFEVQRDVGRRSGDAKCRIHFEFDKFHITSESRAVMSGLYWVSTEAAAMPTVSHEFSRSEVLSADGYAHAVAALRTMLLALAQDVGATLQESAHCQT